MRYLKLCFIVFIVTILQGYACFASSKNSGYSVISTIQFQQDSITKNTSSQDSLNLLRDTIFSRNSKTIYNYFSDSLKKNTSVLSLFPASSLHQFIKGQFAGLYVQEPSGEPGSIQNMYIRGSSLPLLSKKDVYQAQPLIVLDGIPLVTEHPFAYDIQQYDFNRVGPATNLFAGIDMDNLASVEVLKDLAATALYGPRAVNGAIILTSKSAKEKRSISFNSYLGMAQRPSVNTINGTYENAFRQRFYDLYTTNGRYSDDENYPIYLSDSLNNAYSGVSDWTDLYYKNALVYGVNLGVSGGTDRANFRFSVGNSKNDGVADGTALNRYSTMFNINMKPIKWLLFSATVNANRLERERNKNLRDRFSQINYFPDLSAPLAPNKEYYGNYLAQFDKGFDNNKTNVIEGKAGLTFELGKFRFSTSLLVDYNEGYRDIFYPRTILQGNSYASNYYGFNQRLMMDNIATYDWKPDNKNDLHFQVGQSTQWDTYKYSNAYAYRGVNDYIKINLLESNPGNSNYLNPLAFPKELTYRFLDKTRENLVSFYGKTDYTYSKKYSISATLRADGSSNAQPTSRWFYSPVIATAWSVKNEFFEKSSKVNDLVLKASVGRLGRLNVYDNYAQGPQYTSSIGYTGNLTVPGYNAFSVLTRPYSYGWVGYGIPWAYSDQINIGLDASFWKNRLQLSFEWYSKTEKNLLLGIPDFAEYGYESSIESGMSLNNSGFDMTFQGNIIKNKALKWTSSLNLNHNTNRLKALPRGLQEIAIDKKLLRVGQPVDQYWVLENRGIYNSQSEIPIVNGELLKYNGIEIQPGDPKWTDQNGDNLIDDHDKVLKGHLLPIISGGFDNTFRYKNWDLNMNLYFNLGREVLNQEMASRFDFINREGNNNVASVKEITFWEKRGDYTKYPLYNPWSTVIPYRVDQDLFLEDASFLKLRMVSLGYDVTKLFKSKKNISKVYAYTAVSNVFVLTKYSGQDPELVNYTGFDTGYGNPIPRTFTFGVKMEL